MSRRRICPYDASRWSSVYQDGEIVMSEPGAAAVAFAWQVHTVQEQWAARADAKAAVVFTVEGAVIAAVVAAVSNPAVSGSVTGWGRVLVGLGVVASLVAVVAALLVVLPRLTSRTATPGPRQLIYFGGLRRWEPSALATRLSEMTAADQIDQLAVQLTRVADGNWLRYNCLRVAVVAAVLGALLLVVGFVLPTPAG